ncbi:hypothetical protein HU200_002088 [Digitaria exilis]|uniref:Uncharacterized protein n=1 Tax=Digitaria exilis TaxID=1010633 RepID=A0A835FX83_9POAL|nr:hypothetical protein HU200_002088 [Digitaria exilis]
MSSMLGCSEMGSHQVESELCNLLSLYFVRSQSRAGILLTYFSLPGCNVLIVLVSWPTLLISASVPATPSSPGRLEPRGGTSRLSVVRNSQFLRSRCADTVTSIGIFAATLLDGLRLRFALQLASCLPSLLWQRTSLTLAEDRLRRTLEYLEMEVGLDTAYIVHRPVLLGFSMKRLMSRHYVFKVLKGKGMLKKDAGFYSVVSLNEKTFAQKFLDPYKESVPWLADAYVAASVSQSPPVLFKYLTSVIDIMT